MHPSFPTEYFHKLPECIFFYWKIHVFSAILTYQIGIVTINLILYGKVWCSAIMRYQTKGTCSSFIDLEVENDEIKSVEFFGGCNGNLKGISALVTGMKVDDAISKLKGIRCGFKPTSCPDQLAQALEGIKSGSL